MSTALLGLPDRRHRREHPFWHRPAPAVAVVRLDPGFSTLRSLLPEGWKPLVRVKYLLDALTTLARTAGPVEWWGFPGCEPLLDALVHNFEDLARVAADSLVGQQAKAAAEATREYTATRSWPLSDLVRPCPGQVWMHYGPLRPWAMQESPEPLALLVGRPEATAQHWIDGVTSARPVLEDAVARLLRASVRAPAVMPEMFAVDLLLVGGTADSGHKNFAHFFPLETPAGRACEGDFTVVFSDVHAERLTRCSLRLLSAVSARDQEIDPGEITRASLGWFRAHDMAHFWAKGESAQVAQVGDKPFDAMVLEEALADSLGLLALAEIEDRAALGAAFSSELLRYLSRNHHEFADTTAAALELGWLDADTALPWGDPARWLESAQPALARLARALQAALGGDPEPLPDLRRSLQAGRHRVAQLYGPLAALPTDLEYSFG